MAQYKLEAGTARVDVGGVTASAPIKAGETSATVTLALSAGKARLTTHLDESNRGSRGAFFIDVKYLGK